MHEIDKTKLSDQRKYRLYKIKTFENYFINEINERESYSKKLSKYVTISDYIDKMLIVLSVTSSGVSIISFASTIGVPAGIASVCFTLIFSIIAGIIKRLLSTRIKKKKTHDQILMLTKSKYNSVETLISQALADMNIRHKEFITILEKKDKYESMKEHIKNENEGNKQKIIKLSSIKHTL